MNTPVLLRKAVLNNVEWCDAVASAHYVKTERLDNTWFTIEPMPPFYPNLITTSTDAFQPALINDIMGSFLGHWTMKDSFNLFEEKQDDYHRLFSAFWYGFTAPKGSQNEKNLLPYQTVTNETDLQNWIEAWGETPEDLTVFNANLLANQDVTFIYFSEQDTISCGAVLYDSCDVIGISNLFGSKEDQQRLIRTVQLTHPKRDLVGYGSEAEVTLLKPFGFQELGKLNVLKSK